MYCTYCGKSAVTSCSACGRRLCGGHRRMWLTGSVCVDCRARLAVRMGYVVTVALVAGLLLAVVLELINRL